MATSDQPVLNLNEIEKQEIEESQPLAAGATNPYGKEQFAAGLDTASAERGQGMSYPPAPASANPAQGAPDELETSGGEAQGLEKVKEGVKELLGLK